jgi:hypothetical protein
MSKSDTSRWLKVGLRMVVGDVFYAINDIKWNEETRTRKWSMLTCMTKRTPSNLALYKELTHEDWKEHEDDPPGSGVVIMTLLSNDEIDALWEKRDRKWDTYNDETNEECFNLFNRY